MEVTGSELARVAKISRQAINKALNQGKLTRNENKKYDTNELINSQWLRARSIKESAFIKDGELFQSQEIKRPKPTPKPRDSLTKKPKNNGKKGNNGQGYEDDDLSDKTAAELTPAEFEDIIALPAQFKSMTLEMMVVQFGNYPGMKAHAELLDKLMSGLKKSVEIQKIKHELIERDFFKSHVKAYLDVLSEQLFDYAQNDQNMLKDFEKMINHAQQNIDRELNKMLRIQETAIA